MKPLTTTNGTEELTRFLCIITAALYHMSVNPNFINLFCIVSAIGI
jgi:hypothetical protein